MVLLNGRTMAITKYINIKDVVKLTGYSIDEIRNLAKTGVLPAHKTRRGHWRLHVDAVEKYFDIQINSPEKEVEKPVIKPVIRKVLPKAATYYKPVNKSNTLKKDSSTNKEIYNIEERKSFAQQPILSRETRLIINNSHYQEVIERICSAKSSIRILTADFKRFRLKPTNNQGKGYNDGTPFIKYLMTKAVQGVSVQIICSRPSSTFTEEWKEYYQQMMNPALFEYKFCERNHAKVVIVDDMFAYIGSANVTPAGLGQGIFTPGNFEAGIITEDLSLISSAKELFSLIWNDKYCANCHRSDKCTE